MEPKQKNLGQLTTYSKKAPPKRDNAPEPKKEKKKKRKKLLPPPPPVEESIPEPPPEEPEGIDVAVDIKADSVIYECEFCGQVFGSQSWLTRHLKESHP